MPHRTMLYYFEAPYNNENNPFYQPPVRQFPTSNLAQELDHLLPHPHLYQYIPSKISYRFYHIPHFMLDEICKNVSSRCWLLCSIFLDYFFLDSNRNIFEIDKLFVAFVPFQFIFLFTEFL